MTLRERFRSPDSYGLLLVLILFSLVAAAAQGTGDGRRSWPSCSGVPWWP
jgi:hypothetical protein